MKDITFEHVDSLPRTGNNGTLYLVPTVTEGNTANLTDEEMAIAEIADKFTRNEILSSNEIRQIIGFKPSNDPKADELQEVKRGRCPNCGAPLNNVGHCDYCECF